MSMNYGASKGITNVMSILMSSKANDILDKVYEEKKIETKLHTDEIFQMKLSDFIQSESYKALETKANEVGNTITPGYGAEFIPGYVLASNIMGRIKDANSLLSYLPQGNIIPMTNPSHRWGVAGKGLRMKQYGEAGTLGNPSVTDRAETASLSLTSANFKITIGFTQEQLEDSVSNYMKYVENQLRQAQDNTLHWLLINGDKTATNANINSKGVVPTAGTDYLAFDGIRKHAFDKGTTFNAGTVDTSDFRMLRKMIGAKGLNPKDLLYILDYDSYYKILNLPQLETMDKFGVKAIINNGIIESLDGIPVLTRAEMFKTGTDGKVDASTPANNIKGQAALVYLPHLFVGFRKEFSVDGFYDPRADFIYTETGRMRYGQTIADIDGASTALAYNIDLS